MSCISLTNIPAFVSISSSTSDVCEGEKLVNFLVEPKKGIKWPPKLPRFSNRHDAIAICKELCKSQYLLRSEKCGKGELEVRTRHVFLSCDSRKLRFKN